MTVRRLLLGALLGAVAACSNDSAGGAVDGPISYRSTGGFTGGGDGTLPISVEMSGRATRTKMGGGMETAMLDPAMLDSLHDKVSDAAFPALAPMYSCQCADDFTHEVTVQLASKSYNVKADYSASPPAELTALINELREISKASLDWR